MQIAVEKRVLAAVSASEDARLRAQACMLMLSFTINQSPADVDTLIVTRDAVSLGSSLA